MLPLEPGVAPAAGPLGLGLARNSFVRLASGLGVSGLRLRGPGFWLGDPLSGPGWPAVRLEGPLSRPGRPAGWLAGRLFGTGIPHIVGTW